MPYRTTGAVWPPTLILLRTATEPPDVRQRTSEVFLANKRSLSGDSRIDALPTVTASRGLELLGRAIESGKVLLAAGVPADDYTQWATTTRGFLGRAFGSLSPNVNSVMDIGRYGSFPIGPAPEWYAEHRRESLSSQLRVLQGLVEVLQVDAENDSPEDRLSTPQAPPAGRRVFVVHGHDLEALHLCAAFLTKLGLEPVVLHEQPNAGRTIIEKFVDYSDVAFAVVLLTPDDRGGSATSAGDAHLPRARQNVVLELGYFLGRLGRSRVCALYVSGVEIPSDYSGVLFVPFDESGGWRLALGRELKGAGFNVDLNRAV